MQKTQPENKLERHYSWEELQTMLGGISRTTWWRMRRRGEAPDPIRLSPQLHVWAESDINAFLAKRRGE